MHKRKMHGFGGTPLSKPINIDCIKDDQGFDDAVEVAAEEVVSVIVEEKYSPEKDVL